MYPQVRELVPTLEDDILESYQEHHVVDVLLQELAALRPDDEAFEPKFTVLMENVRHHVKEEEDEESGSPRSATSWAEPSCRRSAPAWSS